MTVILTKEKPFAQGGNRLCFVHPNNSERCIKIRRPDFSVEERRKKKGFPKNLKPLSSFDDNLEEFRVLESFKAHLDASAFELLSRCYGFVETDMGRGLMSELILDDGRTISKTLKEHIWNEGFDQETQRAVEYFTEQWKRLAIPSRDLLLHNIVVQKENGNIRRLVVIDGLGIPGIIPFYWLPKRFMVSKAKRKIINLNERIQLLASQRDSGVFPGTHGLLFHSDVSKNENLGDDQ